MTTDAITCPRCNAADRSAADAHGVHVCEYCGIRYRLRGGQPKALRFQPAVTGAPFRSPSVLLALTAALAVGVLIGRTTTAPVDPPPALASEPAPDPSITPTPPLPALPPSLTPTVATPYTPPPPGAAQATFRHDFTKPGYKGSLYVLGAVTNTSAFPLRGPSIDVVLVDAQGGEVGVDKGYTSVSVLEPGASTPVSIMLSNPPPYARMEFEIDARALQPDTKPEPRVRVVDPVAEREGETGRWKFRGRIVNDDAVALIHARVDIYGITPDGKTAGRAQTYADIEQLEPGRSARWSIVVDDFIEPPSRFEYLTNASFVR